MGFPRDEQRDSFLTFRAIQIKLQTLMDIGLNFVVINIFSSDSQRG